MLSGSVYIPLFMQGVLGFSATNSGLVMMPMTLAMVAGSMVSGQVVSRTGKYKWICTGGLAVATGGLAMLATLDAESSQALGMTGMAVLGGGLGLSFPPLVLAGQNAVPFSMMGVSTSLNQFSRSVGGTIGVAIMGSILTRRLNDELASGLPGEVQAGAPGPLLEALKNPRLLLDEGALASVRDEGFAAVFGGDAGRLFDLTLTSMKEALATSIAEVFMISAVLMGVGFGLSFLLRELPLRTSNAPVPESAGAREQAGGAAPEAGAAGGSG